MERSAERKHKRESRPQPPAPEPIREEEDVDSDLTDDDSDEIMDAMSTYFVSADGVPISDSLLIIAKAVVGMGATVERLATKMIKISKIQAKELQAISAALAPADEEYVEDEEVVEIKDSGEEMP